MPAPHFTQHRHWPRRLLKAAGVVLLASVAAIVIVVALNRFDEPLRRDTQAWLDYPGPAAPEAQNGYLALLALDAQVARPISGAGAVARAQYAIQADARKLHQETLQRYREIRIRLLNPTHTFIPFLPDCKDDCYAYFQQHASLLDHLADGRADLIARYSTMLDAPAYAEDIPTDAELSFLPPNYGLARGLGMLHLDRVVRALQRGDALIAYREWARHQRFWQMAAAGSVSLNSVLKAVAQLERSQALLASMLAAHPESAATARRYALPVLAARKPLTSALARSLVREFQIHASIITDKIAHYSLSDILTMGLLDDYPAGPRERLALLFYQRNATLNLLHRLHQNSMAKHSAVLDGKVQPADPEIEAACVGQWDWHLLSNPTGRQLACEAPVDYRAHHERVAKADAAAQQLKQTLRAIR